MSKHNRFHRECQANSAVSTILKKRGLTTRLKPDRLHVDLPQGLQLTGYPQQAGCYKVGDMRVLIDGKGVRLDELSQPLISYLEDLAFEITQNEEFKRMKENQRYDLEMEKSLRKTFEICDSYMEKLIGDE